jgi:hypothetical protein
MIDLVETAGVEKVAEGNIGEHVRMWRSEARPSEGARAPEGRHHDEQMSSARRQKAMGSIRSLTRVAKVLPHVA